MGLGNGISVMGKNTDLDANQVGSDQQLVNQLLLRSLAQPARPDLSWTQGAARAAEMLVSAYKQKQLQAKQDTYNTARQQSMSGLATALAGGNPQQIASAIAQMKDPQSQMMGLQQMASMNTARQAQGYNLQTKGVEHVLGSDTQNQAYNQGLGTKQYENQLQEHQQNQQAQNQITTQGAQIAGEQGRDTNRVQLENQGKLQNDPKAQILNQMMAYQKVIDNPNATPALKDLAQTQLNGMASVNSQAQHPINPNVGMTSGTGILGNGGGGGVGASGGNSGAGGKGGAAAPDLQAQANQAKDMIANNQQTIKNIQNGDYTNADATGFGRAANEAGAVLGIGNHSAAIAQADQTAAQSTIKGIQNILSMGGSIRITRPVVDLIQKATINPHDLPEAMVQKLDMQNQLLERSITLGNVQQQYIDKNGGIDRKDSTTGKTWEGVNNSFWNQNPLLSYQDHQKALAQQLDQQNKNTQPNMSQNAPDMGAQPTPQNAQNIPDISAPKQSQPGTYSASVSQGSLQSPDQGASQPLDTQSANPTPISNQSQPPINSTPYVPPTSPPPGGSQVDNQSAPSAMNISNPYPSPSMGAIPDQGGNYSQNPYAMNIPALPPSQGVDQNALMASLLKNQQSDPYSQFSLDGAGSY